MGKLSTSAVLIVIMSCSSLNNAKNMALETNDVMDQYISTTINFIFDMFLKHYTRKLIENNETSIAVQDFEKSFATKIFSLDLEAALVVNEGRAGNLSTLHRTGDADMDRSDNGIDLTAHVGLSELKIDFNNYDISALGQHQKGKIHTTVEDNSVWLKLKAHTKPCSVVLTDFKIEKLINIKVDITNLGVFEGLTDDVTSWLINELTKWYHRYIEQTVFPELAKAVTDADLCRYWPL